MRNKYLVLIVGPTGVGKTDLTIDIALHFSSIIISADSRQIYKELKIGTAVPTKEQLQRVQHYFIRNKSIHDYYNASKFEYEVLDLLSELYNEYDIIFMTGGSGLYIDAVCKGIDDLPEIDPQLRKELVERYNKEGIESIRMQLKKLDPVHYEKVDLRNQKRILKALEVCIQTGKPYSSLLTKPRKERPFNTIKIGLNRDRQELYDRINLRAMEMMDNGWIDETQKYKEFQHLNALNTVGYKEIFSHINGDCDLESTIEKIQNNTRKYARKQLTWFNKDKDIEWFHPDHKEVIIDYLENRLKNE